MAIAFVETDLIAETFQRCQEEAPASLRPLYTYFNQQWLGNVPLKMWNVKDADIRTNNHCEGWHNRFNRAVNKHHPNIWHLLRCIMEEQASNQITLRQIEAGECMQQKKKRFRDCERRIENLKKKYNAGEIDVLCFMDGIGYNIKNF